LYQGDALHLLKALPKHAVDMIFADPPFNLGKDYGPGIADDMRDEEYLSWSVSWLNEC
jgi:site-specific DNA-methyltransferase (adenine-specific)